MTWDRNSDEWIAWKKEYDRKRYIKNRAAMKAQRRAYYWNNRDKVIAQSKLYRVSNPDVTRRMQRRSHLWSTYGLTTERYDLLCRKQKHRCAICCMKPKKLVVDHEHGTTKRFRGLLCARCNAGIGFLGESQKTLRRAIAYLRRCAHV